ncbi:hypothetical protein Hanom_Chr02g00119391 [Helianthus anomalus]
MLHSKSPASPLLGLLSFDEDVRWGVRFGTSPKPADMSLETNSQVRYKNRRKFKKTIN